jgi:serralysin
LRSVFAALSSRDTRVVEAAGEGVDTVYAWQNVNLSRYADVEHATAVGDGTYAAGNGGDNIIEGRDGRQQLYGGGGQDVLLGGQAADTFIIYKGQGNDVIWDFAAEDVIRLKAGVSSFTALKAAMRQDGADVRIDLGGGDGLLVRNWTIDKFTAAHFQLDLDRTRLGKATFAEEFSAPFSMWDAVHAPSGVWNMSYDYAGANEPGSYTLVSNDEEQIYTSPYFRDHPGAFQETPFVQNGAESLSIQARASQNPEIWGYQYTSGMISTRHKAVDSWEPQSSGFSQKYGYFEIRADVPEVAGAWPAFWMLPSNFEHPPELDIFEVLGDEPNVVWTTTHSKASGTHERIGQANFVPGTGYHTYGALDDH